MSNLLHRLNFGCINQGMALLPAKMDSLRARALLLKIGLQESRFVHRDQVDRNGADVLGPALGLWQFERGGVAALLTHPATREHMRSLCKRFDLPWDSRAIWAALKTNDTLAAAVARLNLYWAPQALPDIHDAESSWLYYLNCWRPGAVKRDPDGLRAKWGRNHDAVVAYLLDPA